MSVMDLSCSVSSPVLGAATAAINAMRAAEAGVARQKAQAGYAAVAFDGSLHQCHCLLTAASEGLRVEGGSGWWRVVAAAAGWLADICSRAQQCISCKVRGPALRQAEDVFHRVLQAPPLVPQLCQCLADASKVGAPGAEAADAAVAALAAMVHATANSSNAASAADHFPLAQMLTAKLNDPADQGVDGDISLLEVSVCVCV